MTVYLPAVLISQTANGVTTNIIGDLPTGSTLSGTISGITISNDTTTVSTVYPVFTSSTSGSISTSSVSSSKLYFVPNTGTLAATNFNSLSDETLKDNIVPIMDSMEILKALRPVSFTWKDNGKKSYGLIAQEVEKIIPELVETTDGIKSVNYSALIAFLIDAVVSNSSIANKT